MPPDFERTIWIDHPQWAPKSTRHKHFNLPLRLVLEEGRGGSNVGVETAGKVGGKRRFIGYLPGFIVPHVAGGLRAKAPIEVRFIDVGRRRKWCSIDIFCDGEAFYDAQKQMGRAARAQSQRQREVSAERDAYIEARLAERRAKLRGAAAKTAAAGGKASVAVSKAAIAGGRRAPGLIAKAWKKLLLWTNQ